MVDAVHDVDDVVAAGLARPLGLHDLLVLDLGTGRGRLGRGRGGLHLVGRSRLGKRGLRRQWLSRRRAGLGSGRRRAEQPKQAHGQRQGGRGG